MWVNLAVEYALGPFAVKQRLILVDLVDQSSLTSCANLGVQTHFAEQSWFLQKRCWGMLKPNGAKMRSGKLY